MRTIPDALRDLLYSGSYEPAVKIEVGDFAFTRDYMSSCSNIKEVDPKWTHVEGGRLLLVDHEEQVWTSKLELLLNNSDLMLNGVDLTGEKLRVYWGGYIEAGNEESAMYSCCAPLRVRTHDNSSEEGFLHSTITCFGMMDELNHDKATVKFTGTDEYTVEMLVDKILKADLEPYEGCEVFVVNWISKDILVQTVTPGESFVIEVNETRLQSIARLLNMTRTVIRASAEEETESGKRTFDLFVPARSGSEYAVHYMIEEIPFHAKRAIKSLVLPNTIIVRTPANISPVISGTALDSISIMKYKAVPHTEYIASLESQSQAQSIADAMLSNVQAQRKVGSALTPLDFSLEVFDWSRVTDEREQTDIEGNVGVLNRIFDAQKGQYIQNFSMGGWLNVKKVEMPSMLEATPPWKITRHIPTWYVDGELAVGTQQVITVRFPYITTWSIILAHVKEVADQDIILDFNIDGVTVHNNSVRLTIPAGTQTGSVAMMPGDNGSGKTSSGIDYRIPVGAEITMDIDQCGSVAAPGENLTVQLFINVGWDEE